MATVRCLNECGFRKLLSGVTLLLTYFCILFSHEVLGQNTGSEVIRVDTELASFEISVTDATGKPVKNLSAEEFKIFENGVERPVDFFQPLRRRDGERPLSIVFAVDVSGSMTDAELLKLRDAMQQFIDRLADYNSQFAIMTFSMNVKVVQPFTNRRDRLERTFRQIIGDRRGLSTHAYDAVDDAIRLIQRRSPKAFRTGVPRRAVIVITDGFPVGDVVDSQTVIERANEAETSVYALILPSFSRLSGSSRPVMTPFEASGLVERTGGKSLYANQQSYEPIFAALVEEITSSYAIAFYPERDQPGEYSDVTIRSVSGFNVIQNRSRYRLPR